MLHWEIPYLVYSFEVSIAFWKSRLVILPFPLGSSSKKDSEEVRFFRRRNMLKNRRISSKSWDDSIKVSTSCFPMVPLTTFPDKSYLNWICIMAISSSYCIKKLHFLSILKPTPILSFRVWLYCGMLNNYGFWNSWKVFYLQGFKTLIYQLTLDFGFS